MTTQPDNLEPWQRVARELGTFAFNREPGDAWMQEVGGGIGRYVLAEPACREIARLRQEIGTADLFAEIRRRTPAHRFVALVERGGTFTAEVQFGKAWHSATGDTPNEALARLLAMVGGDDQ